MSSEQIATDVVAESSGPTSGSTQPPRSARVGGLRNRFLILIVAVIALDIAAFMFFPPFPREGAPGDPCPFPVCFIEGSLEFPAPHTVIDLAPDSAPGRRRARSPSTRRISNTILTMWIVMALVLAGAILMTRGGKLIPGRGQNLFEFAYEFLSNFGIGLAGPKARPYIPIFAAFFLLILFDNWIGLVPPVGKIQQLRAPSSDVNITIGMALISFLIFHFEGFRHLGVARLPRQVLPVRRVPQGDRRRHHRHVRRPDRAHARVRQAGHAVDAIVRQHLRRRGGAGRHHLADDRLHPGGASSPWSSCSTRSRRSSSAS